VRINWLIYPFLPRLRVVSFSEGVKNAGRVYRSTPDELIIVKMPGVVLKVTGDIPLIPDSRGYVVLGEADGGRVVPYFTRKQFEALKKGVDAAVLIRMVSEEESSRVEELTEYFVGVVKDVMEKLKIAVSKNIELMGREVVKAEEIIGEAIKGPGEPDFLQKLVKAFGKAEEGGEEEKGGEAEGEEAGA